MTAAAHEQVSIPTSHSVLEIAGENVHTGSRINSRLRPPRLRPNEMVCLSCCGWPARLSLTPALAGDYSCCGAEGDCSATGANPNFSMR